MKKKESSLNFNAILIILIKSNFIFIKLRYYLNTYKVSKSLKSLFKLKCNLKA